MTVPISLYDCMQISNICHSLMYFDCEVLDIKIENTFFVAMVTHFALHLYSDYNATTTWAADSQNNSSAMCLKFQAGIDRLADHYGSAKVNEVKDPNVYLPLVFNSDVWHQALLVPDQFIIHSPIWSPESGTPPTFP